MVPSGHGNGGHSAGDPDGIGSGFTVIVMHLPLALRNDPGGQGGEGTVAAAGGAVILGGHSHAPSRRIGQFHPGNKDRFQQ